MSGQLIPVDRRLRASAAIYAILGLAFGVSTPFVLAHLDRTGDLPYMAGFQALAGPFESLGRPMFVALGWLLVAVCGADVAIAVLLWRGRRPGAWLAAATEPIALVLAIGFALPLILVGLPVRVALLVLGRRGLRP